MGRFVEFSVNEMRVRGLLVQSWFSCINDYHYSSYVCSQYCFIYKQYKNISGIEQSFIQHMHPKYRLIQTPKFTA